MPDGTVLRARGECEGEIMHGPKGDGGFGYDPVFKPDAVERGMAELTPDEKNAISHRGKALSKGGITESVVDSVSAALKARELVKGKVLENSMLTAREACDELCEKCRAEGVQVIGTKFVLYKRNEKEPKIVLVKDKKK